jgi:magnesium chelatase family protein
LSSPCRRIALYPLADDVGFKTERVGFLPRLAAVEIQRRRFGADSTMTNGRMTSRLLRNHAVLDKEGERILRQAVSELGLSARALDKVLRVARTIADLPGEENVTATHVSEAIQNRRLDGSL